MTQTPPESPNRQRVRVRRHRRERQVLLFGVLVAGIALIGIFFAGVYKGDVSGPFSEPFVTPPSVFETEVNIPCPPTDALPLAPTEVALRVFNGTERGGLAGTTADDLEGRGFVTVGAANWSQDYSGTTRIIYGEKGLLSAYTLSTYFTDFELVLDTRDSAVLDLVLGSDYVQGESLRAQDAPALDPETPLVRPQQCVPLDLVVAEPAPRTIPDNPLASATPSPSPSASASADASADE